ncbi:MAG: peptidylprolyl isomerase [Rhodobacterales bacterium]|nr:peptidylprolyl isomerase [Rhodobacterales bacterium]
MSMAASGDTVRIHYTGTLTDGTTFDSSEGREPLEFTLGTQSVIPGFETAVTGMAVGEKKEITIPCAEAYGDHNPEMVQEVPMANLPSDVPLEVGTQLQAQTPDGQTFAVVVVAVNDNSAVLDGNHPLAGHDLTFAIELVEIV